MASSGKIEGQWLSLLSNFTDCFKKISMKIKKSKKEADKKKPLTRKERCVCVRACGARVLR
jgi:hypothetical protein